MTQTNHNQLSSSDSEEILQQEIARLQKLLAEKDGLNRSQKILQPEPIIEVTEHVDDRLKDLAVEDVIDKFLVSSRIEILYILRSMMRSKSLTTLSFGDDVILTTIIGVNARNREIVFECGADNSANLRAVKARKLKASSLLNQVPVYFTCLDFDRIEFGGVAALRTKFPKSLRRIQKREHFRTDISTNNLLICKWPISEGVFVNTLVENISQGGMLVIDPSHKVPLEIGAEYQGCLIDLTSVGTAKVNLRVKSISEVIHRNGAKCLHAGIEFTGTTEKRALTMIQQYVIKLKIEGQIA